MGDIPKVEDVEHRHLPAKSWGFEEWIVNNDLYCGKRLHFQGAFGHTSLHFHAKKHETMYVESGVFTVQIVETKTGIPTDLVLIEGQSIVIPPNTPHRITCISNEAVMVEFSTHHEDSDSYRVHP